MRAAFTDGGSQDLQRADISNDGFLPSSTSTGTADTNTLPSLSTAASAGPGQKDFTRALQNYCSRQSHLPPTGSTAFNPYLSPAWAGLKIPG
jgi:hypothetical protein